MEAFVNPFLNNIDRYPISIMSPGEGAELFGTGGEVYLDFWSDESTQGLGYGSRVNAAIIRAMAHPHQLPDIYPNPMRTALAKRLCAEYDFEKVFFSNSGAEANETAIKAARKFWWDAGLPHKKVIYTVKGNFHGRTMGALGASDSIGSGSPYHKVGFSSTYGGEMDVEAGISWPGYSVIDLERPIDTQLDPNWTAAIIMAPILGNNCVKVYGSDTLRRIRNFCDANRILLIFDEVQTGSGWTGFYSAAQFYGIQPDIMTLGKRIALGFPMSATLFGAGIGDCIEKGGHFNTFAGSPFVCSLANEWMDYLAATGLAKIASSGAYLERRLREIGQVETVNRVGMMLSFQPKYDGYTTEELCQAALAEELLIVSHRPLGEIRFTPPCATPAHQLEEGINRLRKAFARVSN